MPAVTMLDATTISLPIRRDWQELYERFWHPEAFPLWASGLAEAGLRQDGDLWRAQGPEGPVTIRFTPHNAYGIMDHTVDLGEGRVVSMPMRVIPNGDGCLVSVTLFRQPDMSDAKLKEDVDWIQRDLTALKTLAEADRT
jgi:hypothetical protein